MTINQYINALEKRYKSGISTEHTFRADLQVLLETLAPGVSVINEPKSYDFGRPDYIVQMQNLSIGYIEAKNIGTDLSGKDFAEQFNRYRNALNNLLFIDYLDFHFYLNGEQTNSVKIAEVINDTIRPINANFNRFMQLISEFCSYRLQVISFPEILAEAMAQKARLLADEIESVIKRGFDAGEESSLKNQLQVFSEILLHDIEPAKFADMYAQTITYGLFAARIQNPDVADFNRRDAGGLIPKTNPFLRTFFQLIAAFDLDKRIAWIVDGLAEMFRMTNIEDLLSRFGNFIETQDPIIYFYETFLEKYDPELRKEFGSWYTPVPVVNFMVRAVDDILMGEFGLPMGLADNSKIIINERTGNNRNKREVHKVQILDPALGTGTFLAETTKQIYRKFGTQRGIWSGYVEDHLIPRLNGFEIQMAPYAMAHLKIGMLLSETGYKPQNNKRLRIYLTNSLDDASGEYATIPFAEWLITEANEANEVKRDIPVMVILGNPPYRRYSTNNSDWIVSLIDEYKREPVTGQRLEERNPGPLNDDYVKFLRYGQFFIERNKIGVLAFINAHGFLSNPTFRGMRWKLLQAYDKIYTIGVLCIIHIAIVFYCLM